MSDNILDEDLLPSNKSFKRIKILFYLSLGIHYFGRAFIVMHWPGGNFFILISACVSLGFGVVYFIKTKVDIRVKLFTATILLNSLYFFFSKFHVNVNVLLLFFGINLLAAWIAYKLSK